MLELRLCPTLETVAYEALKCSDRLSLTETDLTLCERSSMRRFHVSCYARIALLCALLHMLSIENEVIPIHPTALENGH
jgi:hypothetical protein